jgi:hypothetical protein
LTGEERREGEDEKLKRKVEEERKGKANRLKRRIAAGRVWELLMRES